MTVSWQTPENDSVLGIRPPRRTYAGGAPALWAKPLTPERRALVRMLTVRETRGPWAHTESVTVTVPYLIAPTFNGAVGSYPSDTRDWEAGADDPHIMRLKPVN